jgi:glycosyltransferase involved in cell wall biosynthesis
MKTLQLLAGAKTGGAETAFVDSCVAMAENGFDVEVATRANDIRIPRLKAAGIKTYVLPFGSKLDIYTSWKLARIIKKSKPDIVQTWMSRAASKVPKPPKDKNYQVVSRLGGYYKIKYFANTDYFMPITPDIGRHLMGNGVQADKICHINNFAETETDYTPVKRADFETPDDATIVLTLSRLHKSKALDTLMHAVKEVNNIYLWLAGDGPDKDKLKALAYKLEIEDRVRFLGWREDRAALLGTADICCFPSRYEPFGTVFVQAWANKTPLIVSLADGPKQFVKDKSDCLAFAIDDVEALTGNLKLLRDNKALGIDLVENGYKRYEGEFSMQKTMQDYKDFFTKIIENSKSK